MAKHYLSQLKGKWGLLIFGILGIVLLLYGGHSDGKTANVVGESYFDEAEEYRVSLEARLEELCASVAGVSSPDVFITLDSGEVSEYAANGSGQYVLSGGDGLLVSRKMPRICGVAVVCYGGERIEVKRELSELISAALNIGTHRIHISGR